MEFNFNTAKKVIDDTHVPFFCVIKDCDQSVTHNEPFNLCEEHFLDWELHDAEYQADIATERLAAIQKKHTRKLRIGNEMTERIKDTFREWLKR